MAHGQGLLVSRRAQHGRCHHRPVGRALPVRLPDRARELRAAVGVRAGGGAHTGSDVGRRVLARGAASLSARTGRRTSPGTDGDAQRSGRRAVSRRADPHGQHLYHLAATLEPRRRGATRVGGAAVRCGSRAGRAGSARARAISSHDGALSFDPFPGPRGLAWLCCRGSVRGAGSGGVCGAVRHPGRAGDRARFGCAGSGLLERRAQQRRRVCRGRRGNSDARSHARLRAPCGTQRLRARRGAGFGARATPCPERCWRSDC